MRIPKISPWCFKTLEEASHALSIGQISSVALTKHCIEQINATRHLNMFVTDTFDTALASAAASDERRSQGKPPLGPLDGIPVAVKDIFCTKDVKTTMASKMLSNFVPPYESTATQRLANAGAISLGKLNMDEFGMGSATTRSIFGPTRNPWDENATAGGSSGASAAAVTSGCVFAALGSDTGGSVRQPAAFCGVVGLKPTYGRVSRHGMIAYASSLDTPGIMARTVTDASLVLDVIAGEDERDSTTLSSTIKKEESTKRPLRVGVPKEYMVSDLPDEMTQAWESGIEFMEAAGFEIVPVSLPHTKHALPAYYVIACAEAASNLARYDGVRYGHRSSSIVSQQPKDSGDDEMAVDALHELYCHSRSEGFGIEVQRRILSGNFVLSAGAYADYYEKAVVVRELIRSDFQKVFDSEAADVLLTPVSPTPPFSIESAMNEKNDGDSSDPVKMYLNDIFTLPASLAGIPALSLPVGKTTTELPLGLQIIAPKESESLLIKAGVAFEKQAKFM